MPGEDYPRRQGAVLNTGDLQTMLASGNLAVTTTGSGVQAKDIIVASGFSWSTCTTLALEADRGGAGWLQSVNPT